jgi:cell division protein FtsB
VDASVQAEKDRTADHSRPVRGFAYFGFHTYHGQYGINSRERIEVQTARLQEKLDKLRAERSELEKRVRLLHDGTLEKDMLDELARKTLNMSGPDEVIIMLR